MNISVRVLRLKCKDLVSLEGGCNDGVGEKASSCHGRVHGVHKSHESDIPVVPVSQPVSSRSELTTRFKCERTWS